MHPRTHLLKIQIPLFLVAFLFITVKSAYAQGEGGAPATPLLSNCSPIPAGNCQIQITVSYPLTTTVDHWKIHVDQDEPFSPTHVQTEILPGSIAIVVDASDVMRDKQYVPPGEQPLLSQISNAISDLNKKLLAANPQTTQDDLSQLLWTVFFIGAEKADDLKTWCDILPSNCPNKSNIWTNESNIPGNAVHSFAETYETAPNLPGTPFLEPLIKIINSFQDQPGPKQIVCFCEGLDGGESPSPDDPRVSKLIELAKTKQIRIHIVHMWKASGYDATDFLKKLAEGTDGNYQLATEIDGKFSVRADKITSVWEAVTQELNHYRYTLTTSLSKQARQLQVQYQNIEGNWTSSPTVSLDPTVNPSESSISINGQNVDIATHGSPQAIKIAPNATSIEIQISGDGRLSVEYVKMGDRSWTVDELKNVPIAELFAATDKPVTLQGELTVIDSASRDPILLPLTFAIEPPAPPLLLDFKRDKDEYVVISAPEGETLVTIPVQPPDTIEYDLKPKTLTCEIIDGTKKNMSTSSDMRCLIPIDEIVDRESQLRVTLKDQFGFEYSGQALLRLANPITEPTPTPSLSERLTAVVTLLAGVPRWVWWPISIGIVGLSVIAVILFNWRHKPDFEPDDEATERVGAGNFFPPTPLPGGTEVTERLSHVLPVAKLILKHAPVEDRNTLASDITLYPNTLKWGIGREESKLLVEPEYQGAEPIAIRAKSVSRVQARLEFHIDDESFFLIGDMTANGTYINRTKLDPLEPYPLRAGDEVQFGKIAYEFKILEMNLQEAFSEFAISQNKDGSVSKKVMGTNLNQTEK
jgi:hypothetical protein